MYDYLAKSKTDLQIHVQVKHEECLENNTNYLEPEILVGVVENEDIEEYETEENVVETDLENRAAQKQSTSEIKLEVFLLSLNVNEAYVNKSDTFIDEDNLQWHSVDILLTYTNNYSTMWEESNFRRQIFQKCYLWDTYSDYFGEISNMSKEERKQRAQLK